MNRIFDITADKQSLRLETGAHAEVVFTVTNKSGRPLRGFARTRALANTEQQWLSLAGDAERAFGVDGVHQFKVVVEVPKTAKPGPARFRLDAFSVEKPEDDFTEGQDVSLEIVAAAISIPDPDPNRKWLWWVAAGGVLLAMIAAAAFLMLPPTVPDVIQKRIDQGLEELAHEEYENVEVKPVVSEAKAGTIVSQEPQAGTRAKADQKIMLEVAMATVPTLIGMDPISAAQHISEAGLAISPDEGDVAVLVVASPSDDGKIVRQDPPPGANAPFGARVRVWIGNRSDQPVHPIDPRILQGLRVERLLRLPQ